MPREKDTAAWLRQEYGDDLPALPCDGGRRGGRRALAQGAAPDRPAHQGRSVLHRGRSRTRFDNIDPIAIREALAERGIVNGQVVDPEKLDSDPFIRQVMRDVEAVATEEQGRGSGKAACAGLIRPARHPRGRQPSPSAAANLPTRWTLPCRDGEYEAIRQAIPEKKVYDPAAPV